MVIHIFAAAPENKDSMVDRKLANYGNIRSTIKEGELFRRNLVSSNPDVSKPIFQGSTKKYLLLVKKDLFRGFVNPY